MKNKNYRISEKALQDLADIWEFTNNRWSKEQADRYFHLIMNGIEFVAKNPASGKSYNFLRENYWRIKVKSHLIFYRRVDNNSVDIVRILHQRMDSKRHFK